MGDPSGGNKIQKTHEGEHQGDYSDVSLKLTKHTFIFAMCAAINSCNLGFDVGVSSNAGVLLQRDLGLTDVQRELFVGSINFWSIFGSLFSNWICDRYGRRQSFIWAAISFIIGLVIQAASNSYAVLMIGRVFVGLGVGFGLAVRKQETIFLILYEKVWALSVDGYLSLHRTMLTFLLSSFV